MTLLRRPAVGASLLGLAVLLAACSLPDVGLWNAGGLADTGLYGLYGHRVATGLLPYRDFYMEFPPGALPALVVPDLLSHRHYAAAFHGVQAACLGLALVGLVLTLTGAGVRGRRLYALVVAAAVAPAVLGPISLNAFDSWPALLTMAATALAVRGRTTAAGAVLGLSAATKLFGVLALPVLVVHVALTRGPRAALRPAVAFAAALAAVWLPFFALAPGGLGYSLKTQFERGLQIESLWASLLTVGHRLGIYEARVTIGKPFSVDLAGGLPHALSILSSLLVAAAVVAVWVSHLRGAPTVERLLTAIATSVVAFVALGRVVSPQYMLWLIPLVPVAGEAATAVLLVALALTLVWARFPEPFGAMSRLGPESWAVLARNLVVVGLYVLLLWRLRRTSSTP